MDTIIWAFGFPVLLACITLGVGTGFAVNSPDSMGFLVAKTCFVAATFVAVALIVYWVVVSRQAFPLNITLPALMALIAVPALVVGLQWMQGAELSLSTRLMPGNGPTPVLPPSMRDNALPPTALKVFLGSNLAWATRMPHTVLMMGGEKMIEINRDSSGNLVVSTLKIFDDRNNIIARIDEEDGFWVENSTRKKRPDPSTLLVFDHTDREVLRIQLINKDSLSVTGTFRNPRVVQSIIVTPEFTKIGGMTLSGNSFGESGLADIAVGQ